MTDLLLPLLLFAVPAFAAGNDSPPQTCCCVGAVIAILAAIGFNESRKKKDDTIGSTGNPPGAPSGPLPTSLQIRAVSAAKDFGSGLLDCVCLKMRGPINLPPAQLTAVLNLSMWDVTKGESREKRQPVLCSIPDFQLKGTQVFLWTHVMQMPYSQSMLADWTELLTIPVEMLTFPARGQRKLMFEFTVSALGNMGGSQNRAVCRYDHISEVYGYVDGIRMRIKAEELGLKFAAAVSAVDGEQDEAEKNVVRQWMDSRIESLPEDMRAETARVLSRALMLAERLGATIKPEEISVMCEELVHQYPVNSLPRGDLYDVVKLCMEVAAADGTAGPEELKLIDLISTLLGVDRETFTRYRDKLLPASMHSEKDINSILGIDPGWSPNQKKKHLRELYREWSSRVTHSDPKVRDQAEEMLKMIADERAVIDAES